MGRDLPSSWSFYGAKEAIVDLQEFLFKNRDKLVKPQITCTDGFKISIQASRGHYCIPRNDVGPYTHVEVGYPSEPDPLLAEYAEDPVELTLTVYPYVPVGIVQQVIDKHGGMSDNK
ncbi:MAG: hypothetical protein D6698_06510 [Gammaproteobacteria bacterium]|nr:MAG: hypothetical protein D6698_06510 [Gammaproteobacteria bacterium]